MLYGGSYTRTTDWNVSVDIRRQERYLFRKFQLCKALIAEKEANIVRLQAEIDALQLRKERLGRNWAESKRILKESKGG